MEYRNTRRFLRNYSKNFTDVKHTPKNIGKLFIIFIPVFIYTWLYVQATKTDLKINNDLKLELNNLKAENQKLDAELQIMTSSKKIEEIAKAKYGYKIPDPGQIFIINKPKKDFFNFSKKSNVYE